MVFLTVCHRQLGFVYIKTMKIQFENLITPLADEEFQQLTENIKKYGCRDALVVWDNILLDGHNRLKICKKNNVKYKIKEIQLKDKSEAEMWIIKNQLARRNLSDIDKMDLTEMLREKITEKAKKAMKKGGGSGISGRAISPEPIKTDKKLSEISGNIEKENWDGAINNIPFN